MRPTRPVLLRYDHRCSSLNDKLDLALHSRSPEHGLGRDHPETAAGHGRLTSTAQSNQKWGITGSPMKNSKFILVRGFWYSGSSAVIEFLLDKSGVHDHNVGRPRELSLVAAETASLTTISEEIKKGVFSSNSIKQLWYKLDPDSDDKSLEAHRIRDFNASHGPSAIRAHNWLIERLYSLLGKEYALVNNRSSLLSDFYSTAREYLELIYSLSGNYSGLPVVVDNDPGMFFTDSNVTKIDTRLLYGDGPELIVVRDPRDSFTSIYRRGLFSDDTVPMELYYRFFYYSIVRTIYQFDERRCLIVRFEDFVKSAKARDSVLQFCGIGKGSRRNYFNADESAQSIGRYSLLSGCEKCDIELKRLTKAFPRLCNEKLSPNELGFLEPLKLIYPMDFIQREDKLSIVGGSELSQLVGLLGFSVAERDGIWSSRARCRILIPHFLFLSTRQSADLDNMFLKLSFTMFPGGGGPRTVARFISASREESFETDGSWTTEYSFDVWPESGKFATDIYVEIINPKTIDDEPRSDSRPLGIFLTRITAHPLSVAEEVNQVTAPEKLEVSGSELCDKVGPAGREDLS
jgi:hypothetical protein